MRFLRQSLLLCAAALLTSLTGQAEIKVLQNFTLIDGTGKEPVRDAAIVINNGRIQYAGPKSSMKAPQGAERID
ncbi:MAG: amidohydrolase family protein, partial [Bryobacteraceae bacterium]